MNGPTRQHHWDHVYSTQGEHEVSWFQESPSPSPELLELVGATRDSAVIDIGGGTSRLVDLLVGRGFTDVTVLDLSEAALAVSKARLGNDADKVKWVVADVTTWKPERQYDVWHDRATFHFLTDASDRSKYIEHLKSALRPGGYLIIGTFAPDGPEKCSGLPVMRYDAGSLGQLLGDTFALVDTRRHEHVTPRGASQRFQFSTFRRLA